MSEMRLKLNVELLGLSFQCMLMGTATFYPADRELPQSEKKSINASINAPGQRVSSDSGPIGPTRHRSATCDLQATP
jgi:hypothetical protein